MKCPKCGKESLSLVAGIPIQHGEVQFSQMKPDFVECLECGTVYEIASWETGWPSARISLGPAIGSHDDGPDMRLTAQSP